MPNKVSYQKLLEGVKDVINRGDYPEFLKAIKKLRNDYSFRNTLLVFSQNPRSTFVKGFVDWNKFGRGIKKRPKTIYIYVPMKYKYKKEIEGQQNIDGKEEKEKNSTTIEIIDGIKYRRVAVYDISDTYIKKGGRKIPILEDRLEGNTTVDFYNKLISISPVEIIERTILGGTNGYYSKNENKIYLEESLPQDQKTKTLLHELTHCLYDDFDYGKDRDKSETFVESVAFLVADFFGFDTSLFSFGYITSWINNDINNFMKVSNKIKEDADKFIELIKQSDYGQEKFIA